MWVGTGVTVVAVMGMLAAEWAGRSGWRGACKVVASSGFVATAIAAGAGGSAYGRAIAAALGLAWLGDVALLGGGSRMLIAGMAAFFAAHVAYSVAFVSRGLVLGYVGVAIAVVAAVGWTATRRLLPKVRAGMRGPVVVYGVALSTMVVLAAASTRTRRLCHALALAGAVAFYLSDLAVARVRLVKGVTEREKRRARAWGTPLYYAAQLLFAWSVAVGGADR